MNLGATTRVHGSRHRGKEWSAAGELEYAVPLGSVELRPMLGLRHADLREAAFAESGDAATALTVERRRTGNTTVSGGARALLPFDGGGWEFRALASHLSGDRDSPVSARLAGQAAAFTASGTPLKRNALELGAAVAAKIGKRASAYADLAYETRGSGQSAYAVTAGLRIVW